MEGNLVKYSKEEYSAFCNLIATRFIHQYNNGAYSCLNFYFDVSKYNTFKYALANTSGFKVYKITNESTYRDSDGSLINSSGASELTTTNGEYNITGIDKILVSITLANPSNSTKKVIYINSLILY